MSKIIKKCLTCGNANPGQGRYCPTCEEFFKKIDSEREKCFSEAPYTGCGMPFPPGFWTLYPCIEKALRCRDEK